jgi:aryl-alcohol dehydrogenase-like predicted oxidoreductase
MDYRNLGRTGLKVSPLCMGTMQFGWTADEDTAYQVLNATFESGINFIDTADVYSRWVEGNPGGVAETIIGDWIRKFDIPRHQLVIATKVRGQMGDGPNDQGLSRAHIMYAVEQSLRRLQIDYIDLYQTHYPDLTTPVEETLRALDDLVKQGKVRYVGCSNYKAWQLMESLWVADKYDLVRYDSLQPHYSLVKRAEFERELEDVCWAYDIGVIPYSPLGGGFLTGKYRRDGDEVESARAGGAARYFTERNWNLLDKMEEIGRGYGGSISQVALAWQIANPVITSPIIGPRNLEQLQDNLGAVEIALTEEEIKILNDASAWEE